MDTNEGTRFGLLEIDGFATPKAEPVAPPAPLAWEGTGTTDNMDLEGRARAIASNALAEKHGLTPSEATLYKVGTVGEWGNAAKAKRLELAARPFVAEANEEICALVKAEARRSSTVSLNALKYVNDRLCASSATGAEMTPHAFRQMLTRAGAPGYAAGYLSSPEVPSALRAPHVQHWLDCATDEGDAIKAVALSKLVGASRHIYGMVSEKYGIFDMDKVCAMAVSLVPSASKASYKYDALTTRWSIDLTIGAEFEPVVGDIHRVNLRISGHDAGGGSIQVKLFAERVRCLNFSQIQLSSKIKGKIRHMGDNIATRVRGLLSVQGEALHDFNDAWKEANETAIISDVQAGNGDARDVFRALITKGYVDAPDGTEVAVENFFNAYLAEPGQTRADYVNAITRAAHTAPWSSPWASEALEEQAGQLLYNRVVLTARDLEA